MIEDKEGDAEKNEAVDVQLNNTKAAPPFSFVDDWFFNTPWQYIASSL